MKLTFNKYHCVAFILLFLIEVLIAAFLKDGFIRHTVGDYLVVILIYCFIRSFCKVDVFIVAITTLAIAYTVEFLQLTDFLEYLGLKHNKWANLIFGNSFSVQDLVAYTLGVLTIVWVDSRTNLCEIPRASE